MKKIISKLVFEICKWGTIVLFLPMIIFNLVVFFDIFFWSNQLPVWIEPVADQLRRLIGVLFMAAIVLAICDREEDADEKK